MKKFSLIIVLLAAFAFIFISCPTEGDPNEGPGNGGGDPTSIKITTVFSGTLTNQDKATVTITETGATFTTKVAADMWGELVTPSETPWNLSAYTGIKFEYKAAENMSVFLQDTTNMFIFGYDGSDGWGAISFAEEWATITLPFSILIGNDWFGDSAPLNKTSVIKLMFGMASGTVEIGDKVEIRNLQAY